MSNPVFVLANLVMATAQILDYVLWAYAWVLLGRMVISFINVDFDNPIVRFIYAATEPVLEKVRAHLPVSTSAFDLSPLAVWLAIIFVQQFLVRSLYDLAFALRG